MKMVLALSFSVLGVPDLAGFQTICFTWAKDNNQAIISDDCACLPEYLDSRRILLSNTKKWQILFCVHVMSC